MQYYAITYSDSYLQHHGIIGMKWGVRRFQDKAGHLTAAGRKRLGYSVERVKDTVKDPEFQRKAKTAAKVAGVAAATGLAAYGAYKIGGGKASAKTVAKGASIIKAMSGAASAVGKADAIKKTVDAANDISKMKMPIEAKAPVSRGKKILGSMIGIGGGLAATKVADVYSNRKEAKYKDAKNAKGASNMSSVYSKLAKESYDNGDIEAAKVYAEKADQYKITAKSIESKYTIRNEKKRFAMLDEMEKGLFNKNQSDLEEWMKKAGY